MRGLLWHTELPRCGSSPLPRSGIHSSLNLNFYVPLCFSQLWRYSWSNLAILFHGIHAVGQLELVWNSWGWVPHSLTGPMDSKEEFSEGAVLLNLSLASVELAGNSAKMVKDSVYPSVTRFFSNTRVTPTLNHSLGLSSTTAYVWSFFFFIHFLIFPTETTARLFLIFFCYKYLFPNIPPNFQA